MRVAACSVFVLFLAWISTGEATAAIVNGGFETGDATGWSFGTPGPPPDPAGANLITWPVANGAVQGGASSGSYFGEVSETAPGVRNGGANYDYHSFYPFLEQRFSAIQGQLLSFNLSWNLGISGMLNGAMSSFAVDVTGSGTAPYHYNRQNESGENAAPDIGDWSPFHYEVPATGEYTFRIIATAQRGSATAGFSIGATATVRIDDLALSPDGDANNDGLVDGADYTIWSDNFRGASASWTEGDFNGDQRVSAADYTIWADNFSPAETFATRPIPEPSSLLLGAVGLLLVLGFQCRQGR